MQSRNRLHFLGILPCHGIVKHDIFAACELVIAAASVCVNTVYLVFPAALRAAVEFVNVVDTGNINAVA